DMLAAARVGDADLALPIERGFPLVGELPASCGAGRVATANFRDLASLRREAPRLNDGAVRWVAGERPHDGKLRRECRREANEGARGEGRFLAILINDCTAPTERILMVTLDVLADLARALRGQGPLRLHRKDFVRASKAPPLAQTAPCMADFEGLAGCDLELVGPALKRAPGLAGQPAACVAMRPRLEEVRAALRELAQAGEKECPPFPMRLACFLRLRALRKGGEALFAAGLDS
ncbi:unnamed protein product, partial [Prorocentrum cordatum]